MQPVGEAALMAEGVWQLKLPVPLPLRFVSAYMIEAGDGWTLLDAGFDYPPTREIWERGAAAAGFELSRDVVRIVVSHFHPDHIGGARWLQERTGAPVWMLEEEIRLSRHVWEGYAVELFSEHLLRHGMPRRLLEAAVPEMRAGVLLPEEMLPLRVGEKVPCGGGSARVVRAPGHADNQLALHDEARGLFFAADHVMLGITPNIGLWPETAPRPLARYLDSLESLRGLGVETVLPGHGPIFHDLEGRIEELACHHEERLQAMLAVLGDDPKTSYEVSLEVFRESLTIYERCFALAETLAHLEHLALLGRAERVENGVAAYRAL